MLLCKLAMITNSPDYSLSRIWSIVCHRRGRACLKRSNTNTFPPQKKSHDISLHTNALDSNLDKNSTLHPSSQTPNYSTGPTTHFSRDPMSMTLLFFLPITKMQEFSTTLFYIESCNVSNAMIDLMKL